MKVLPGQLSLPLFEPDSCDRHEPHARPRPSQPQSRSLVVSGRSKTQSGQTTASAEPATASTAPALLTIHEAADLLHVHPRTVQRLVERGELGAVRLGSAVRYDPLDLKALTDRLKRYAPATAAAPSAAVRPSRPASVSFADRLRSQQHEHRAAPA